MSRWVWMLVFAAAVPAAVSMLASGDASSRSNDAEPASGPAIVKGDVACDFDVDAVDALQVLRSVAGLSPDQEPNCPGIDEKVPMGDAPFSFGDMDCDFDVDAVDALQILLFVAGLETDLPPGCTEIGTPIFFIVLPPPEGLPGVQCWVAMASYHLLSEDPATGEMSCGGLASAPLGGFPAEWTCDFPDPIPGFYSFDCTYQQPVLGGETISYTCEVNAADRSANCIGSEGVETGKQPDYDCAVSDAEGGGDQVICAPVLEGAAPYYYCEPQNADTVECFVELSPGSDALFKCTRSGQQFACLQS